MQPLASTIIVNKIERASRRKDLDTDLTTLLHLVVAIISVSQAQGKPNFQRPTARLRSPIESRQPWNRAVRHRNL